MEDLRGQCYDGAANMSGRATGVQAKLKKVQPKALYVHCTAHRFQLAVQATMTAVREVRDAIGEAAKLIEFFRHSPKRLACLRVIGASSSLRPLCPTRWTCSEPALRSILDNWIAIRASLDDISHDRTTSVEAGSTGSGLLKSMSSFDFWFGINLASHLFMMTNPVAKAVQSTKATVSSNLRLVGELEAGVRDQRERFPAFWEKMIAKADELEIDPPRTRRPTRRRRRLDEGAAPHQPASPEEEYRRVYCSAVDNLAGWLESRFNTGDDSILATAEEALVTGDSKATEAAADVFGLDANRLILHTEILHDTCSRRGTRLTSLHDITTLLSKDSVLRDLLPEVTQLARLMLTVPATSCSSERSFSLLRRLKSYLRTNMSQVKLNYAAVCATYAEELNELDLTDLIAEFIGRSAKRQRLFGAC